MLEAKHDHTNIGAIQEAIQGGKSVVAVVQEYLDAINHLDKDLNAVTFVSKQALAEAEALDKLPASQRGLLHGVPIIVKDQIETEGMPTAFGSKTCKDYTPARDATLVTKLKAAGAVIIGKSTMPDWAASWFSTSSLSETTKNPHDLSRDPGGSSSGSGAAVAAGLAAVAIGGDTGGSIRLPSSFCGLVGVRVTPGRISRDGMSALVETQDTPGPMAHTVEDAARVLDVIVGFDVRDPYTTINAMVPGSKFGTCFQDAIKKPSLESKRIGVLRQAFGTHSGVQRVMEDTLKTLSASGAELIDVLILDLDYYKTFTSVYGTRSKADINTFLASRPALSHLKIEDLQARGDYHKALDLIDVIAQGPDDFTKDPDMAKRLLEQARFQRIVASIFAEERLDAIVYPTCQLLAPKTQDLLDGRWTCLNYPTNTIIASELLFPAISVPVGKAKDDEFPDDPDLPIGLEILGLPLGEEKLLGVAAGVEAARKVSGLSKK